MRRVTDYRRRQTPTTVTSQPPITLCVGGPVIGLMVVCCVHPFIIPLMRHERVRYSQYNTDLIVLICCFMGHLIDECLQN